LYLPYLALPNSFFFRLIYIFLFLTVDNTAAIRLAKFYFSFSGTIDSFIDGAATNRYS
jgi:hypothetical protein